MATGTDYMLESLLRLAGIDVEKAKASILQLGVKFHEQDALLRRLEHNQKLIMQALNISEDNDGKEQGRDDRTIRIAGS